MGGRLRKRIIRVQLEKEGHNRKTDIRYVRRRLPNAEFVEMKGLGHADMASLRPQELAERFRALIE